MRNTIQALLCSMLATACAPVGGQTGDDTTDPSTTSKPAETACSDLTIKTTDITIAGASGFKNLPRKCWKLDGTLTLSGALVTSMADLGDLREVTNLVIDDTGLTKLDSKNKIEVSGDVTIMYNDKLADITNLTVKPKLLGGITIESNAVLAGLGGMSAAVELKGGLEINSNPLIKMADFSKVTRVASGITISDNAALLSINLTSLNSTGDLSAQSGLTIRSNPKLTTLSSLAELQYVHGNLTIDDNDSLQSLEGTMTSAPANFAARKVTVDLNVVVTGNTKLLDTGGLSHLMFVGGSVQVSGNPSLTYCEVREIDCCVNKGNRQVLALNNATTSCGSNSYSWCYQQLGYCPYQQ